MKSLLLGGALALALGCRTIESRAPAAAPAPLVRVGTRARTWEVRCEGERLGLVVLFQERGLARDSIYLVRNPWHQDLGLIDGLGRAYRYLPHREEPAWVGSGTIAAGAQSILGLEAPCVLVELSETTQGPGSGSQETSGVRAASSAAESPASAADPRSSDGLPPDGGLPQSR